MKNNVVISVFIIFAVSALAAFFLLNQKPNEETQQIIDLSMGKDDNNDQQMLVDVRRLIPNVNHQSIIEFCEIKDGIVIETCHDYLNELKAKFIFKRDLPATTPLANVRFFYRRNGKLHKMKAAYILFRPPETIKKPSPQTRSDTPLSDKEIAKQMAEYSPPPPNEAEKLITGYYFQERFDGFDWGNGIILPVLPQKMIKGFEALALETRYRVEAYKMPIAKDESAESMQATLEMPTTAEEGKLYTFDLIFEPIEVKPQPVIKPERQSIKLRITKPLDVPFTMEENFEANEVWSISAVFLAAGSNRCITLAKAGQSSDLLLANGKAGQSSDLLLASRTDSISATCFRSR